MSRRVRWLAGAATVSVVAVSLFSGIGHSAVAAPFRALSLPTWDDVQAAKNNEAAAAEKVVEIEALVAQVQNLVEETRRKSESATAVADRAQHAFLAAHEKTVELERQAAESEVEAKEAADQAASLVSQMYRSGGVDRNLELFLQTDEDTADVLLDRLAMMSKATERNTSISEQAQLAMNNAQSLGEQALAAQNERERLHVIAEQEATVAAQAADSARVELQAQEQQQTELEAQLAALKDDTVATVEGYRERLRIEEEERIERERQAAAAAAAARAAYEEQLRQQQQNQNNNTGGGGNSGGGSTGGGNTGGGGGGGTVAPPVTGGWTHPLAGSAYRVTTEWWGYTGHEGIDLGAAAWTPIYATASGTVNQSGWWGGCGNTAAVNHGDGTMTRYCHMVRSPSVSLGQWVGAGQILGYVGTTGTSTGNHLHLETHVNGYPQNPRPFMSARGVYF